MERTAENPSKFPLHILLRPCLLFVLLICMGQQVSASCMAVAPYSPNVQKNEKRNSRTKVVRVKNFLKEHKKTLGGVVALICCGGLAFQYFRNSNSDLSVVSTSVPPPSNDVAKPAVTKLDKIKRIGDACYQDPFSGLEQGSVNNLGFCVRKSLGQFMTWCGRGTVPASGEMLLAIGSTGTEMIANTPVEPEKGIIKGIIDFMSRYITRTPMDSLNKKGVFCTLVVGLFVGGVLRKNKGSNWMWSSLRLIMGYGANNLGPALLFEAGVNVSRQTGFNKVLDLPWNKGKERYSWIKKIDEGYRKFWYGNENGGGDDNPCHMFIDIFCGVCFVVGGLCFYDHFTKKNESKDNEKKMVVPKKSRKKVSEERLEPSDASGIQDWLIRKIVSLVSKLPDRARNKVYDILGV